MESGSYRVGVDIGGTFTDIVFLGRDGRILTKKISSSVQDYAQAIADGLTAVFGEAGLNAECVAEVLHGTTVASNAILEMKGARTGLITSKGFRDVLEIRTLRIPRLYDLTWEKPPPMVERYLRLTVDERINGDGTVEKPLHPAEVERAVDQLLAEGVEALAVCLINSFANPVHEQMIKEIIEHRAPGLPTTISFDVLPEIKEYERTSTTVINSYVKPIVARYLESLEQRFDQQGLRSPLLLMQSNGGLTTARTAGRMPMHIIESGPAGGVIGGQMLATQSSLGNIITFDMGGTTAKASLVENGQVTRTPEYQVGGGIMMGSRLLTGAGYLLKVPAIDLAEVGAGGGSIVWIDPGGSLQVGPQSAGAEPGPLCYGKGGLEPTVTDANLLLGYLNPDFLVGGELPLEAEQTRRIFKEKIAAPLGLTEDHAAYGVHQIAAANMMRAIKSVSTERGRDPREFTLLAFGGNGPLFAAGMARELGIKRIAVPLCPGLFSSFGLLYAKVEHHYSRTLRRLLRGLELAELNRVWNAMAATALEQLAEEGYPEGQTHIERAATLHYQGQSFELTIPVAPGVLNAEALTALEEDFGREHERTYGHRAGADEPVELVSLIVVASGDSEQSRMPAKILPPPGIIPSADRKAYFGPEQGWLDCAVIAREDLKSARKGPCIVEEYDATCLIPPGAHASLDEYGTIMIELD